MKLDEKYFVPFLAIVAIVTALLILFFTISSKENREQVFKERLAEQDSLKYAYMPTIEGADSLGVQSFPDSYIIIDFWATWTSSFSERAHRQLSELHETYPERVEIIAAVVEDKKENVKEYVVRYNYPFHYVNGTKTFNKFQLPGVPTQLVYAPSGTLQSIFTGYADSARYDSLRSMISNE